jgi:hypothetical protein
MGREQKELMDSNQFQKDITVDRMQLDQEWLTYPDKVWQYTKLHADALALRNQTKEELNIVESELYLQAKSNLEETFPTIKDSKISEATINNWVVTQPRYRKAIEAYLTASHNADILRGAVSTIEVLKNTLGNMVSLWLANYYSIPKLTGGVEKQRPEEESRQAQLAGLEDVKSDLEKIRRRKV